MLSDIDFEALLADTSKRVDGDIGWSRDEDHSPAVEFRVDVDTTAGWPLFVRGSYNPLARTLTYALILHTEGRIYALDLGKDHHNPQCHQVGETHKHSWTVKYRDKEAYAPDDITATADDPVAVWVQFCAEAGIIHTGALAQPQKDLFE